MLGGLGFAYTDLGDYSKAIEYHTAALAIAREIGDRQNADIHLGELGIVHRKSWGTTRRPSRIQHQTAALAIAWEIGDWQLEGNSLGSLGTAHIA
jgi:tetratricopeptide (TPR) repeat protein